jgi:hypothetical protein
MLSACQDITFRLEDDKTWEAFAFGNILLFYTGRFAMIPLFFFSLLSFQSSTHILPCCMWLNLLLPFLIVSPSFHIDLNTRLNFFRSSTFQDSLVTACIP